MADVAQHLADLKAAIALRGKEPSGCLVAWAEVAEGFVAGLAVFYDEPKEARPLRDYGALRLVERWLPMGEVFTAMTATLTENEQGGGLGFGKFERTHLERRIGHYENCTGWPEWVLTASHVARQSGHSPRLPNAPVVSHGLPPFSSGGRAAEDWIWGDRLPHQDENLRHKNELLVVLPDTRGALGSIRWEGNRISGTVHTTGSPEALEVQVAIDTDSGRQVLEPLRPAPSAFAWDVPGNARAAEVYLVHASRELMGTSKLSPGATVADPSKLLTPVEQADRDLSDGENDRVEFKPFIVRTNEKESELIETVIAFANTVGGRLYIGVRNDGEPEGEAAFRRVTQGDSSDSEKKYLAYVDGLFRERIKPVPRFEVQLVGVSGHRVIMVTVEPGDERPYSSKSNDLWVRKGASNIRPDPKTELPKLYERNHHGAVPLDLFGDSGVLGRIF